MRKHFLKSILVVATSVLYILPAFAQNLYVRNTDDTQDIYTLSSISKLSFSDGNVTVHKTDNSTAVHAINEIRYISFINFIGIDMPDEQANMLTVYPNPANNLLNIILPSDKLGGEMQVFGIDGKTLISCKITNSQTVINLNALPQGIYLCRYVHGTYTETVKVIKQN